MFIGCALVSVSAQAKTLVEYLGHVTSLSTQFEQRVFAEETTQPPEQSQGALLVQSPNKFRLEYSQPYEQLYVADGERLWSYDADLEQVTVKKQLNLLANSPAVVLSNPAQINKAYVVQSQGKQDGMDWFHLSPKNPDSQFDHIRLGFDNEQLAIMELFDSFGQRTQLRFRDMQYNTQPDQKQFQFIPPDGVDVVGDIPLQ